MIEFVNRLEILFLKNLLIELNLDEGYYHFWLFYYFYSKNYIREWNQWRNQIKYIYFNIFLNGKEIEITIPSFDFIGV